MISVITVGMCGVPRCPEVIQNKKTHLVIIYIDKGKLMTHNLYIMCAKFTW